VNEKERDELVDELMARLEARGAPAGGTLLDLMRAEQNLVDALGVIRRQIAAIVRATASEPS
jgi:mevalonate kinase